MRCITSLLEFDRFAVDTMPLVCWCLEALQVKYTYAIENAANRSTTGEVSGMCAAAQFHRRS